MIFDGARGRDLNPHTFRQRFLRPSCLPFHHSGQGPQCSIAEGLANVEVKSATLREFPELRHAAMPSCYAKPAHIMILGT